MKIHWKGVYPAITTKFNEDGSLDFETFEKNIHTQLDAGIHGIILGGTLGEASTLKNGEKLQLLEKTLELVDGNIPVIINIAEPTTDAAIEAALDAQKNGAAGLMLLPPMRYKADDRETVEYFKAVAESTELPIMIYNNPVDYGIEVTLDMFEQLTEHENIQAVKESTRDVTNVTRMINRFGDRFSVLCGVDTLAMETLLLGASGWVAGLVCAFPRETVSIYELCKAGKVDEAAEIYRWFMPLLELDINPKLVQNIKLAEVATGIGTEHVRKPRLKLAGKEREHVLGVIDSAMKARPKITQYLVNQKQPV
ncbi:dihydrodipicolinate synthase family protein [Rhodohalobacter sp. SW132]|uniref:dihydrodipicolinate synthase family protein n=1 Tax=Rhodohalobacter sp. SW132 TaxID=2293433 RepID=UPI000E2549DC|nr:dihydrodipicolinate synthase family protein [Rhodohalobacter sp. SW132]REL38027.1 dihydrodipicolinate synthase family protein [Rhodohalobacter sp. SW132]